MREGEMNMDWIEAKATWMGYMSKVVQSKLDQVRISITFDMHYMLPHFNLSHVKA